MEKISGLVLDFHDDVDGAVMKAVYPSLGEVPEVVKTASALTPEQRDKLPDDVFALILQQDGARLRKFACVDAGHTLMNIAYLMANHHKLPVEATKVASSRMLHMCGWYDIEPPEELKKLSTGKIATTGKQQYWRDSDGVEYKNNTQSWGLEKSADVSGTALADGNVGRRYSDVNPNRPKKSVVKSAEDRFVAEMMGAAVEEENPEQLPQVSTPMSPVVDVSGKEPPKLVEEKRASRYAMPSLCAYPIDGVDQIKAASAYWTENKRLFEPMDRHEYAVNLVKRAEAVGIPVDSSLYEYAGEKYASENVLRFGIDTRLQLLRPSEGEKQSSADASRLYEELWGKRNSISPDVFALTMYSIDKIAGLNEKYDSHVVDPWACTFCKQAEGADPKDAVVIANEYMKVKDLEVFAQKSYDQVKSRFGEDFVKEFQADPKAIFDSLPVDQKKVIMRMVADSSSLLQGTATA